MAAAAASRSAWSTDAAALAKDSCDIEFVGITCTCMCGTS